VLIQTKLRRARVAGVFGRRAEARDNPGAPVIGEPCGRSVDAALAYRRLRILEGVIGLVLGVSTAAFCVPGRQSVAPLWVSLVAVPPMLGLIVLGLLTWRSLLASELRFWASAGAHPHVAPRHAQRIAGRIARANVALLILLMPVPSDWVTFWFVAGIISLTWGTATLALACYPSRRFARARRSRRTGPSRRQPRPHSPRFWN
jgi:hypothetical protein